MKLFFFIFLSLFFSTESLSQEKGYQIEMMSGLMMVPQSFPSEPDTLKFYHYEEVQIMPEPIGGWSVFYDLLAKLEYPQEAKKNNLEADIGVYFHIDRSGNVNGIKAYDKGIITPERGQCESCRLLIEEVIRGTKWKPGEIHEVKVNTKYDMIISFDIWIKKE